MQITVDLDLCESHGSCVFAAPGIFSFDDDDYLLYEPAPDDGLRGAAEKAAASCPVRAITVAAAP
ncbi:ferredoxin [Streptomyces microflavus]|jgi:ferredoxin|uniref:Ferredoxin n=2 Tax=Streptomyces microflavus TaxID=1919 RepID=A0A6N9V0V4_STRMI|nr:MULTISPECIES: ferredoxin [Streptomyces]MBK3590303.1 ferredoxin [Streptomyces sp. MBT57]NEE46964.1 ferredoxin [Streptomyces sp. SID8455]AGK79210.1 Ferredoxin [Streptomyces microflavus DSM 40593]MBK5994083.1 ferredoxin [Streptomyces sp. MBT58]MBW3360354.1 ferredoxin [Streptomyces sp. 09ZI22]